MATVTETQTAVQPERVTLRAVTPAEQAISRDSAERHPYVVETFRGEHRVKVRGFDDAGAARAYLGLDEPPDLLPTLPFAELVAAQASWYRSVGTVFCDGLAKQIDALADQARLTSAQTWDQLEARLEVLQHDHDARMMDRGASLATADGCRYPL